VYFFVIDVSDSSNGMIHSMVSAIRDSIEELSANTRTQIGILLTSPSPLPLPLVS
jgi:hypothetical protein